MVYFQFRDPDFDKDKSNKKSFLISLLYIILPKANPDFEKKIDLVCEWLIEYDDRENFVNREIGLDKDGNVIMKMPYKNNYGFWTDTNLKIEDFHERFNTISIVSELFYKKWDELL